MTAFTIAQISDLHCGSPHFVPSLLDRALVEINELEPDVVIDGPAAACAAMICAAAARTLSTYHCARL